MARRPTRDPYARPAIQTLERLHAELGGKILENRQEHANLAEQMRHVEAVIKLLERAGFDAVNGYSGAGFGPGSEVFENNRIIDFFS
jgi:hypothetical protein